MALLATLRAESEVELNSSASARVVGEAALVERARAMDEDAWREIVDLYYDRVCAYLENRTGNPSAAEDLTAQVFAEAVARIAKYEWRGLPFGAWLFRIARNFGADYHRSTARRPMPLVEVPVEFEELSRMETLVERDQVRQAMGTLTDEQQQVLTLRFVGTCSIAETAAATGKSEGAVKAIQHRALAAMRRALAAIDPGTWRNDDGNAR